MRTFEEIVEYCSKENSKQVLTNASIAHAHILVARLIKDAAKHKEDIRIVTGCLYKDFYNGLVDELDAALQNGCVINVVVLKKSPSELDGNNFVKKLGEYNNAELIFLDIGADDLPHFIVVGNKRYRLEMDDKQKKAIACFNDEHLGSSLVKLHASILRRRSTIGPPAAAQH